MDIADVDIAFFRTIFGVISIIFCFLYNFQSSYQILADAKKVEIVIWKRFLLLLFYSVLYVPYLYAYSGLEVIWKFFATVEWTLRNHWDCNLLRGQTWVDTRDPENQFGIPTLILMKFDGSSEEFFTAMKLHIQNMLYQKLQQNQALCGRIKSFRGFYYIDKDLKISLDHYVQKFNINDKNISVTKDELLKNIENRLTNSLNSEKRPIWEIHIGIQTVKWNANDDTVYYPVIFEFSHCLFDRVSFMKLILGTFADVKDLNILFSKMQETNNTCYIRYIVSWYMPFVLAFKYIYDFIQKLHWIYENIATILINSTLLKHNTVSVQKQGKQKIFLEVVDFGENFSERVAAMKGDYENATEFNFIEAVVAAGLRQKNIQSTEKILWMSVENNKCLNVINAPPESLKFEKITFENNDGFTLLNACPPERAVIDVKDILTQNNMQRNINTYINETELTRILSKNKVGNFRKSISAVIRNFPGPSSAIYMNGISVEHIITWSPCLLGGGAAFSVCSYRNKYFLTMTVKKSMSGKGNLNKLVQSMATFMDRLLSS